MKRTWGAVLLPPVIGLLAACSAPSRTPRDPFTAAVGASDELVVDAISQAHQRVDLYSTGGGRTRRAIGVLGARQRRLFRIPWTSRAGLQVEIRTRDARFVTPSVTLEPGDTVYLHVQTPLTESRLRR